MKQVPPFQRGGDRPDQATHPHPPHNLQKNPNLVGERDEHMQTHSLAQQPFLVNQVEICGWRRWGKCAEIMRKSAEYAESMCVVSKAKKP